MYNTDNRNTRHNWILDNSDYKNIFINSKDNLRLHGYLVNNIFSNDYVIVVHGYLEKALEMAPFAKHFYELGLNILLPDLRAHGESEGNFIGLGWLDRLDILYWIDYLININPSCKIILFGLSMGGATVMMCSGETLPSNVKLIIEDCGYSSVWDELSHHLYRTFKIPAFPIMNIISFFTKIRVGFYLKPASSCIQLSKCNIPILFIHGDDDEIVPFEMLNEVFLSANSPKEKLVIENAGHGVSYLTCPELYWTTIKNFIAKYLT